MRKGSDKRFFFLVSNLNLNQTILIQFENISN